MILKRTALLLVAMFSVQFLHAQFCPILGFYPQSAYPVCGNISIHQGPFLACGGKNEIFVPGCTGKGHVYFDKNPYWYKFTCYHTGSFGLEITPDDATDDFNWQLFDVTGKSPSVVFNASLAVVVAANWANTAGSTGTSPAGAAQIQCEADNPNTRPSYAAMPDLIQGHNYLLLVSHAVGTGGYNIAFGTSGGTADIRDPSLPHLKSASTPCPGTPLTLTFTKKLKCSSMDGQYNLPGWGASELKLSPNLATAVGGFKFGCDNTFETDSVRISFSNQLPPGTYDLIVQNGFDGNTMLDYCDNAIPVGEKISFTVPPIVLPHMDSVIQPGCSPDVISLYFKKPIYCSSISPDGTQFTITGTSPISVVHAQAGNCSSGSAGVATIVKLTLASPIYGQGNFQIKLQTGSDGSQLSDLCGFKIPDGETVNFVTMDTVNADFTYAIKLGCKYDTIDYMHNANNNVNKWLWTFDGWRTSTLQNPRIIYDTFSLRRAQLIVTNGGCTDTSTANIKLANELKAGFETLDKVCPGQTVIFKDTSVGQISSRLWEFGNGNTSILKSPPSQYYPTPPSNIVVTAKLTIMNTMGCVSIATRNLEIADHCYVFVPGAFTPNRDGLNDYLYPLNIFVTNGFQFNVYNRYGEKVFGTEDPSKRWDGRYKGQVADGGTYMWMLRYIDVNSGETVVQKGTTILLR